MNFKYKSLFFISLLLILSLSIGMVSASSDIVVDDVVSDDTSINSIDQVSVDENEPFEDESDNYDRSFADIRQMIDEASDGDTIDLEGLYYITDVYDMEEGESPVIEINKNLVIEGNGAILDANYESGIFYIDDGVDVVLNNIYFLHGYAYFLGGAIYSEGSLSCFGCTFDNCYDESGPANIIYSEGSLSCSYCLFLSTGCFIGLGESVDLENDVNLNSNYWCQNFVDEEEFNDYCLIASLEFSPEDYWDWHYKDTFVPNDWINIDVVDADDNLFTVSFVNSTGDELTGSFSKDFVIDVYNNVDDENPITEEPLCININNPAQFEYENNDNFVLHLETPRSEDIYESYYYLGSYTFINFIPDDCLFTLRNLINDAENILVLDKDYIRDDIVDKEYGIYDITIDHDLTIDGNGHIINDDGDGLQFIINPGVTVTFKNIEFYHFTNDDGGAIYSEGNLNCFNCTFARCFVWGEGSSIYSTANLTCSNCIFLDQGEYVIVYNPDCDVILDDNYWGSNFNNEEEFSNSNKIISLNDEVNFVPNDWINIDVVDADDNLFTVSFVNSTGDELNGSFAKDLEINVTDIHNDVIATININLNKSAQFEYEHSDNFILYLTIAYDGWDKRVQEYKVINYIPNTSFQQLSSEIYDSESDIFVLDKDYIFDEVIDGVIYELWEGINIDFNLTIDGNGHTIDGNNLARLFNIYEDEGVTVTFKNIKFINGFYYYASSFDGKGIISAYCENVIFENCSFINNHFNVESMEIWEDWDGWHAGFDGRVASVIYSVCSNSTIINNCSFVNNSGTFLFDEGYINGVWVGGPPADIKSVSTIYVGPSNVISYFLLNNSNFEDSDCILFLNYMVPEEDEDEEPFDEELVVDEVDEEDFRRVPIGLLNEDRVVINNCSFNNAVQVVNTPLWADSYACIYNCNFDGDNSEITNSLIYVPYLKLDNCSFTNYNMTTDVYDGFNWVGGIVYAISYFDATNSQFINNTVDGGAGIVRYGDAYIDNCSFINNSAMIGGAIMGYDAHINNSIFINNKALGYEDPVEIEDGEIIEVINPMGGAIYTQGDVYISDSILVNNTASEGGAIYVESSPAYIVDSIIYFIPSLDISNCIFDNNIATDNGNLIFIGLAYGTIYYDEGEWEIEPGWYYNGDIVDMGEEVYVTVIDALSLEDNFWSSNYQSVEEFNESGDIFIHSLNNMPEGPEGPLNIDYSGDFTFAPNSWVVMKINGPDEVPESSDYTVTLNTLNTGSEYEGSLPDYTVAISCFNGDLNQTDVVISDGIGYFKYDTNQPGYDLISVCGAGDSTITSKEIAAKFIPTVNIDETGDVVYGGEPKFSANVTGVDGKIIDDAIINWVVYDKNGNPIPNENWDSLAVGSYTVVASFAGNENYTSASMNKTFDVVDDIAILTLNQSGSYYKGTNLTVKLVKSNGEGLANEEVALKIGSETVYVTTNADGVAIYKVANAPGTYMVTASVCNDGIRANTTSLSVKINKVNVTIIPTKLNTTYNSGKYFQVRVTKDSYNFAGVKLNLRIYTGDSYRDVTLTTSSTGLAKYYTASKIDIGTHKVVVSLLEPSDYMTATSKSSSITINKSPTSVVASNFTTTYDSNEFLNATINTVNGTPISGIQVKFRVYDNESSSSNYTVYKANTDGDGVASLNTSGLAPGLHRVFMYSGDAKYNISKTVYLQINKAPTTAKIFNLTTTCDSGELLNVTIRNKVTTKVVSGIQVKFRVYDNESSDSNYTLYKVNTDSKGVARLNTSGLAPGLHRVFVYSGDAKYNISKTVYLQIDKIPTTAKIFNMTTTYNSGELLNVTIRNKLTTKVVSGLQVKFRVYDDESSDSNYTLYKINTDNKGVASLDTTGLAPGLHRVFVYSGNAKYSISKTVYLRID